MPKQYRNFKIIYENSTFKKNVEFVTADNFNAAMKLVDSRMNSVGYEYWNSTYGGSRRTYRFGPKGVCRWRPSSNQHAVTVTIVNLHYGRKRGVFASKVA